MLAKQQRKTVFFFDILVTKNNLWSQWVTASDTNVIFGEDWACQSQFGEAVSLGSAQVVGGVTTASFFEQIIRN